MSWLSNLVADVSSAGTTFFAREAGLIDDTDHYIGDTSMDIGSIWNDITGAKDMQTNSQQYQTYMSNTAYQRQVADMLKAGINPALAYLNGAQGASTPSGVASAAGGNPIQAAVGLATGIGQLKSAFAQAEQAEANASSAQAQANWTANKNKMISAYYNSLSPGMKAKLNERVFNHEFGPGGIVGQFEGAHNTAGSLWEGIKSWFGSSSGGTKQEKSSGNSSKTVKEEKKESPKYPYPVYRGRSGYDFM